MNDFGLGLLYFSFGVFTTLIVEWLTLLATQSYRWWKLEQEPEDDPFWEI